MSENEYDDYTDGSECYEYKCELCGEYSSKCRCGEDDDGGW